MLVKTAYSELKPAFGSDYEKFQKIPIDEPVVFKWTKQRNIKFHRKFFALLNMIFENQELYSNIDELRYDLTVEAGYYTLKTNFITGEVTRSPKSISFDKMDDLEFSEFYESFIDAVINWLKWEKKDILQNIDQFF